MTPWRPEAGERSWSTTSGASKLHRGRNGVPSIDTVRRTARAAYPAGPHPAGPLPQEAAPRDAALTAVAADIAATFQRPGAFGYERSWQGTRKSPGGGTPGLSRVGELVGIAYTAPIRASGSPSTFATRRLPLG